MVTRAEEVSPSFVPPSTPRAGEVGPAGDRSECGICRRPLPLARMFDSTVRLWPCHLKQFKGAKP